MKQVVLPNTSKLVGRIGFGCAYLVGGLETRASRRIVDAAYDAGIRHFDVAPPYGIGTAENVLGEALRGRRDNVTLVTKVGIRRPTLSLRQELFRFAARPVRKLMPRIARNYGARVLGSGATRGHFQPDFVRDSLEDSLRRLQTDHLDALLLHEVSPEDLTDELLRFLEERQSAGVIGAIGIATSVDRLLAIPPSYRALFQIVQYSWSVLDSEVEGIPRGQFQITHRSILRSHDPLMRWMNEDNSRLRRLSDETGFDLSNPAVLGRVLLGASIARHPEGIVLVGTRNVARIIDNASLLKDETLVLAGAQLRLALSREAGIPKPE